MALNTKPFTRLVQDWVAAVQGASLALLDFTTGSILKAIAEAQSGVALWLQALVLKVLATARLATSSGADVDSFLADFGLSRLSAVATTGLATFARFTATNQAVVPIGAKVQTADGSQTFTVYVDTTNVAYSPTLGGYVIAANVASLAVPVQADNAGAQGNIASGTLTVLQTGISGVDTVTNGAAFTNGVDAESDAAAKLRFIAFILGLQKATPASVTAAILSVQAGLKCSIIENQNFDGSARAGYFTIVVDDGSGAPPSSLLAAVYLAVDKVRPIATSFGVFTPSVTTANVALTIVTAAGYDHPTLTGAVATAIATYLATLQLAQTLSYTRLAQVAYDVSPGVQYVTGFTLNGVTVDLTADGRHIIRPGTITVA